MTAWGVIMRAFPGSFPPAVFDALSLDRYAETFELAVSFLEEEARAVRAARESAR